MTSRISVARRFWAGMFLPTVVLGGYLLMLILVGGKGREFAPFVTLMLSLVLLPGALLANSWVLFVRLHPVLLYAGAAVIPLSVATVLTFFQMGTPAQHRVAAALLEPVADVLKVPPRVLGAMAVVWCVALGGVVLKAVRRQPPS